MFPSQDKELRKQATEMVEGLELKQSSSSDYRRSIRASVYGLWRGEMGIFSFVDSMVTAVDRGLRAAWYEGASHCGIRHGELTPEEESRLVMEINSEISHIYSFGRFIFDRNKLSKGQLSPLYRRADMWANKYLSIVALASTMACGDLKYKWVVNVSKEHCHSCLKLNNRVYRGSTWHNYDIYPRMRNGRLMCGGWKCGCELVPTTDPATPGRPPNLP